MTMRPRPWWAVLGLVGASWVVGCEPKVTVAEEGDAGSDMQAEGGTGALDPVGGSGGKGGSGGDQIAGQGGSGASPGKGGSAGGGGSGAVGGKGGSAGMAGYDYGGNSGSAGVQVEYRPATEEENSLPESCEFSFAPPSQGGSGGQGPVGGSGGQATAGSGNPGGEGGAAPTETAGSAGISGSSGSSGDPPACACTRRPGDGNSFLCPWGEAITVSTQIGPDGGSLMLSGTESTFGVPVELRIPRGALEETVTISITETSLAPPDNLNDWSPLYRLEPADLTFLRPVELRIPWSGLSGFVPSNLSIYFSSEAGGSCDMAPLSDNYVNAGFNHGSLRHLGWAIVGLPKTDGCP